MRYLTASGLDNVGEMLCQFHNQDLVIRRTAGVPEGEPFSKRWHLGPSRETIEPQDRWKFLTTQFFERVKLLSESHPPVVVKAFTSAAFFIDQWRNLERLFENFDVVVLRRCDSFKVALSSEICNQVKTWHVNPGEEENEVRSRLSSLRFTINEFGFLNTMRALNTLKTVHDNISAFGPRHRAITYEDFADSPRERLNELLGHDVPELGLPVKFIDDHEAHVENLERLRELYDRYALK
jgi:hypothetical protein